MRSEGGTMEARTILSAVGEIERRQHKLHRTVIGHTGERGRRFFQARTERLERIASRWRVMVGEPFEGLSYHYVCRATREDGRAAVLKVGVPSPESRNEATALRLLDGQGIERLYESDAEEGALLIERVEPGEMLETFSYADDEAATLVAAGVMRRLWR